MTHKFGASGHEAFAIHRDDWTKRWAPAADRARITFAGGPPADS